MDCKAAATAIDALSVRDCGVGPFNTCSSVGQALHDHYSYTFPNSGMMAIGQWLPISPS